MVCVCMCVYVCVQHSKTLSIVLFLCKVTLSSFWCVCVCVCVYKVSLGGFCVCVCTRSHGTFQNSLYSILVVQSYLEWFLFVHVRACVHALLPQLDCKPSEDKDPTLLTLVLSPELPVPEETLTRCWLLASSHLALINSAVPLWIRQVMR